MSAASSQKQHVHIVGGGLSGCLLALQLVSRGFHDFTLWEQANHLAGDHTWSFHRSDISADAWQLVAPALKAHWHGHDVLFSQYHRPMGGEYATLRSLGLANLVRDRVPSAHLRTGVRVYLEVDGVRIDGQKFMGCVVDARGLGASLPVPCAFQKFVGWDVVFDRPHGWTRPVLMDARVPQKEGYRFVYVLPWDAHRALVEDTRYSDRPDINVEEFSADLHAYVSERTSSPFQVERREQAALPIPLKSWPAPAPLQIGTGAGMFHFTTGYSLPVASQIAEVLAAAAAQGSREFLTERLLHAWEDLVRDISSRNKFHLILNRMLFGAAGPQERRRVFELFYTRPEGLIERFYGLAMRPLDQIRLLVGRPPVPVGRAIRSLVQDSWMRARPDTQAGAS